MKHYDSSFITKAVYQVVKEKRPPLEVAAELNFPVNTLYAWVDRYRKGILKLDLESSSAADLEAKNRELEIRIAALRIEIASLKKVCKQWLGL